MFQFVHIESYSLSTPKKGKRGGHSVSSIISEAARESNSVPHVVNPAPPLYVYGIPLSALEDTCRTWADSLTDGSGKKIRKDALCLLAGVISAPASIEPKAWGKLRDDSIAWLRQKYGERLRTVVEHTDEAHPHIHFYVVPLAAERFDQVHDGKRAAAELRGQRKGQQNAAYIEAMRAFQDDFSHKVGMPNGMLRFGPGRRRLTREAWKLEQLQGQSLSKAFERGQEIREAAEKEAEESHRRMRQEVARAVSAGFSRGAIDGASLFARKSLFGKLAELLTGVARDNESLRRDLSKTREEGRKWQAQARRLRHKAEELLQGLDEVRAEHETLLSRALRKL